MERVEYWRYARTHYRVASGSAEASNFWVGPIPASDAPTAGGDRCMAAAGCRERGRLSGDPFDPANKGDTRLGPVQPDGEERLPPHSLHLNCGRSSGQIGCPSWTTPLLIIYAARITMRDDFVPRISGLDGSLLSGGDLRGSVSAEVFGSDKGAGLRAAAVEIDGRQVLEGAFQPTPRPCHPPYSDPQPCAADGSSTVGLDTRRLSDGAHRLRVLVRDASGNTAASRPYSIAINNGGASCPYGSGPQLRAGFGRRRLRSALTISSTRRAVLSGRLRSQSGAAKGGSSVRVLTQGSGSSEWHQVAYPTTRRDGRFAARLPRGTSRRVRVTYCGRDGGAYRDLRLRAKPSVALKANRRRVRNGRSVIFAGRVRSRPIPRGGKLVELQAFFRGRWRTFQTLHTRHTGTFKFRYWFGGTHGTVKYRFRAVAPREGGFPYTTGSSRRVTVKVSG